MHPDIYRELARQRHEDLDREAARASLAATLHRKVQNDPDSSPAPRLGVQLRSGIRLMLLARAHWALLAIERRVARALADTPAPDNIP